MYWDKKWGKNAICGITFCRLRPGRYKDSYSKCIFLKCGHGFYTRPLFKWIYSSVNPKCPMCRKEIDMIELINKIDFF